jgi:hypothetical protein
LQQADGRESHTVDGEKGDSGAQRYGSMAEIPHQQRMTGARKRGREAEKAAKCCSGEGGDFIETRTGMVKGMSTLNRNSNAKPHSVIHRHRRLRSIVHVHHFQVA